MVWTLCADRSVLSISVRKRMDPNVRNPSGLDRWGLPGSVQHSVAKGWSALFDAAVWLHEAIDLRHGFIQPAYAFVSVIAFGFACPWCLRATAVDGENHHSRVQR